MKIFNTLSKTLEDFKPINSNKVNIFVCGPTVYDYPHLGHAKAYIQFDFIVKYLRYLKYNVFYLMNITDIDDKIIARSKENNINTNDFTKQYTEIFLDDMKRLGNNAVDKYAPATDYIEQIVKQVTTLLEKGYAYKTSDGIYFEISKFTEYGKLSGRTDTHEFDGVSRIDSSTEKIGKNDFCLWKNYKEGEPFWETSLGKGRPGWHIEDTAITETFFGPQYDIHGGGEDLMFPHHEAEIAQMEAASERSPLVRYWMHIGFLNVNSKKMGKSLGNFRTIRDVLEDYDYRTLRNFFISAHYRSQIDFSNETLEAAKNSLKRLDEFVFKIDKDLVIELETSEIEKLKQKVNTSLQNDFNTPEAFAHIFDFIKKKNQSGEKVGKTVYEYIKELDTFFGFLIKSDISEENDIDEKIRQRNKFRSNKEFDKADEIRKELEHRGIIIYDSPSGTSWRKE